MRSHSLAGKHLELRPELPPNVHLYRLSYLQQQQRLPQRGDLRHHGLRSRVHIFEQLPEHAFGQQDSARLRR
jgi:hypothetical protein